MLTGFKQATTIGTRYSGNKYSSPQVNDDSIFVGRCDSKPDKGKAICLGNDDLRQHMLIIGNDNVGFLRSILEQVIKKEQNIFCLKPLSIETLTYLTHVANENGCGEQVLIFSENGFNPIPKLPFNIAFNALGEEWSASWLEIINENMKNILIPANHKHNQLLEEVIYEMFELIVNKVVSTRLLQIAHKLCNGFLLKSKDLSVLAKAFQCSKDTISEFALGQVDFTSKEVSCHIINGLKRQENKFRFIMSIRNYIGDINLNDTHDRIWSNIFVNYKVFFSDVTPEILSVILNIFKHYVRRKLGEYTQPINDKDVYQRDETISFISKSHRRNLCVIDFNAMDTEVFCNSMGSLAIMAAQARGLGFMMIYTSTYLCPNGSPTLDDSNNAEKSRIMQSVVANTNTKVIMDCKNAIPGRGYTLLHQDKSYHVTCDTCQGIDLTGTVYNILVSA